MKVPIALRHRLSPALPNIFFANFAIIYDAFDKMQYLSTKKMFFLQRSQIIQFRVLVFVYIQQKEHPPWLEGAKMVLFYRLFNNCLQG